MSLDKLLTISSSSLSELTPRLSSRLTSAAGRLKEELLSVLWSRNGFFAFESALHFFGMGGGADGFGIEEWNSPGLWYNDYGLNAKQYLFFAEDVFGNQFALRENQVYSFDPETGDETWVAASLNDWAVIIIEHPNQYTGHRLAHDWQMQFGPLSPMERLVPKTPFILGGQYTVDNLVSLNRLKAMKTYANLAVQIRQLPDGASVTFRIVD